jgi:hypothetical protein
MVVKPDIQLHDVIQPPIRLHSATTIHKTALQPFIRLHKEMDTYETHGFIIMYETAQCYNHP